MADFAYWPDKDAGMWIVFIEPLAVLDAVGNANVRRMSEMFSLRLEQINPQYSRSLSKGVIKPYVLNFSQLETHILYRDVECFRKNIVPGQIKPVHFVDATNEVIKRFFTKNILETERA